MPLTKLQFKPGINRESTSYSNEGGWFDCEKVRFRAGFPEKIGGWSKYSSNTFAGKALSHVLAPTIQIPEKYCYTYFSTQ